MLLIWPKLILPHLVEIKDAFLLLYRALIITKKLKELKNPLCIQMSVVQFPGGF